MKLYDFGKYGDEPILGNAIGKLRTMSTYSDDLCECGGQLKFMCIWSVEYIDLNPEPVYVLGPLWELFKNNRPKYWEVKQTVCKWPRKRIWNNFIPTYRDDKCILLYRCECLKCNKEDYKPRRWLDTNKYHECSQYSSVIGHISNKDKHLKFYEKEDWNDKDESI